MASEAYMHGVDMFLDYAFVKENQANQILCLCKKFNNLFEKKKYRGRALSV